MIRLTVLPRLCLALVAVVLFAGCEFGDSGNKGTNGNDVDWTDTCGSDAYTIGEAGKFTRQKLSVDWDFENADMWQNYAPIQLQLPDDLVGLVVTVDDHGRQPGLYEARLDGQLISAAFESQDEAPLSKSITIWSDALSMAVPSNAKTRLKGRRCLELDFVSLGADTGGTPDVYFTALRREGRVRGNRLDIQARIVDDAIAPEDIVRLNQEMAKTFERACANLSQCITPVFVEHYVSLSTPDGAGELEVGDDSDDALHKEISALRCENIENIDCADAERGINIVFVDGLYLEHFDPDLMLAGLAGGIPMVPFDGTAGSSLFISIDAHRTGTERNGPIMMPLLADTIAHELGHALGLFHTTEQRGEEFDAIADTPECDATVYGTDDNGRVDASRCKSVDGENLMFWEAAPWPVKLTEEQMMVLRSHPLIY